MDADDISNERGFGQRPGIFREDKGIDIVGGQITEFVGKPENITGMRCVPESDADIKQYMKKRCPMNHMTVMFRRSAVERAGGYLDWYCNEDYYLWIRMALAGCTFANMPDTLCNVRVGNGMAARRGGWKYFSSEARIQKYMLQKGLIRFPRYLYNVAVRFGGEVIVPDRLRSVLFRVVRSRNKAGKEEGALEAGKLSKKSAGQQDGKQYPPFSVAMCVYGKDNAEWFDEALASVTVNQILKPDEVVLVVDGPVPKSIQDVIGKYSKILWAEVKVIYLKENQGFGKALKVAVENARNDIIARMDSDDIAVPDRFKKQLGRLTGIW